MMTVTPYVTPYFKKLNFSIHIETTEESVIHGSLLNRFETKTSEIVNIRHDEPYIFSDDEMIYQSEEILKNTAAFIGPVIILTSENIEVVYRAKNGSDFSCFELIENIIDFEKLNRPNTDWFGGIDCHHIFYEGLCHVSKNQPKYSVYWGS